MIQNYEIYFIVKPESQEADVKSISEEIANNLKSKVKAENISVEMEGVKKLAYPIKKIKSGFYVLLTFDAPLDGVKNIKEVERILNQNQAVIRFIIVNQTEFLKAKSKEKKFEVETNNHRELNKGKSTKKDILNYMGVKALDYKDFNLLSQFMSPYAKIFTKKRTGTTSKNQRKISTAIKRARHMALLPFTPNHFEN